MNRRGWMLLPALVLYVADIALTLLGQPAGYWSGDHSQAVELNPLAYRFLTLHPAWFVVVALVWAMAFSAVILLWRSRFAVGMAALLAMGHAVGAGSWLVRLGPDGWLWAVFYLATASWITGACWRRAGTD